MKVNPCIHCEHPYFLSFLRKVYVKLRHIFALKLFKKLYIPFLHRLVWGLGKMSAPLHEDKNEDIVFSTKFEIDIVEKIRYSEFKWYRETDAKIRSESINETISIDNKDFEILMKSLSKKLDILKYVSNDTYQSIKKDILRDIVVLIYKLEKGNKE